MPHRLFAPAFSAIAAGWLVGACRSADPGPSPHSMPPRVNAPGAFECPRGRSLVWRGDFDSPDWLSRWDPSARFAFGESDVERIADPRFGGVLRVRYPAGSSSSSYAREGHPMGGAEFRAKLPVSGDRSVFLAYWLRFDPAFPWVRGGKLPGLCGGSCPSGGAHVTGFGGWSMRTMWRRGGEGEGYAYLLPARDYGTEIGKGAWSFRPGTWHRMAEEITLNEGDRDDGRLRVWFDVDPDGPPTFEAQKLAFRRDATPASVLFFSTFFGGHDASWATPIDTYADFAAFVVCR